MATGVAALAVVAAAFAAPQSDSARSARDVVVPFTVGPAECTDRARAYAVTMRIYNVLAQPVGIPILGAAADDAAPPGAVGRPLTRLPLPCGRYAAYWDGRHAGTGLRLAPGVYVYDLVADGQRVTRKITLQR